MLEADSQWYEKLDLDSRSEEVWRDPYVFADPDGNGWHMLITARVPYGNAMGRGVIGYARSDDLEVWEVQPPLSEPAGFGHLEVPQAAVVDEQPVLVFSCLSIHHDPARTEGPPEGGVYVVPGQTLIGPWDIAGAARVDHPSLYAGRLVRDPTNGWALLGFRDTEDGVFVGEITDPIPVVLDAGRMRIVG